MMIYLDESYNLQKGRGQQIITINGFSVLDEKTLRKRWKVIRKPYTKVKRRIHAVDSTFESLRKRAITLLGRHDVNILSCFQIVQEIPHNYFDGRGMVFDLVYADMLRVLFRALQLGEYKRVMVVIDSRKHQGGILAEKMFQKEIVKFFVSQFPNTICSYHPTPSYLDVLLELADFVSNTFYREYQRGITHVFDEFSYRLIQIKNPL